MVGLVSLEWRPQRAPSPLAPCEDTARRHPSRSQEAGSPDTQSALAGISSLQSCGKYMCVVDKPPVHGILLQQLTQTKTVEHLQGRESVLLCVPQGETPGATVRCGLSSFSSGAHLQVSHLQWEVQTNE